MLNHQINPTGSRLPRRTAGTARVFIICALALIMILSVLVRLPDYAGNRDREADEELIDKDGVPYFTEPDAYYHVRMADDLADDGVFGSCTQEGGLRDMLRSVPEGRSTAYQKGIIYSSLGIHRFLNLFIPVTLHQVDFYLSCLFVVLTALAVFLLGLRISGPAGGLTAALLVTCAPVFVKRTMAGSFDTDMTQLLLGTLIIFFLLEALRAETAGRALLFGTLSAAVTALFTLFWMHACLTIPAAGILGSALCMLFLFIREIRAGRGWLRRFFLHPAHIGHLTACILTLLFVILLNGTAYLKSFLNLFTYTGGSTQADLLPNMFASIAEMEPAALAPSGFLSWFSGFVRNQPTTIVNGVGGILVLLLAVLCLLFFAYDLLFHHDRAADEKAKAPGAPEDSSPVPAVKGLPVSAACLPVMGCWLLVCLYASRLGVRFIQHLSAPAGILAGCAVGLLAPVQQGRPTGSARKNASPGGRLILRSVLPLLLGIAVAIPPVRAAFTVRKQIRPAVTDASEKAMDWIAEHAGTPDAAIAAWWDQGYFYEYESGHPVLWDGGSQDAVLALLFSKALVSDDPAFSSALIRMLASCGQRPVLLMAEKLGTEKACRLLWELIPEDRPDALALLTEKGGFSPEEALQIEELIHPETPRETYLLMTWQIMMRLGWIEYYAGWDFKGDVSVPLNVAYHTMPDGSATVESSRPEVQRFFEERGKELIYRLFLNKESEKDNLYFEKMFETEDKWDKAVIWHVTAP